MRSTDAIIRARGRTDGRRVHEPHRRTERDGGHVHNRLRRLQQRVIHVLNHDPIRDVDDKLARPQLEVLREPLWVAQDVLEEEAHRRAVRVVEKLLRCGRRVLAAEQAAHGARLLPVRHEGEVPVVVADSARK